jgi:hypothetical protein
LIGRTPFEAPSDYEVMRMHAETPIPSVVALRPDVPPHLDDVIRRACAKDRDQRFANTEEFLAALDAPPEPRTLPLTVEDRTVVGSGTMPGGEPPSMPALGAFVGRDARPRGVTDEGSALPSAPAREARRSSPLLALGILGALVAGGTAVYFIVVQGATGTAARTTATASPTTATSPTPTAAPTASPTTVTPTATASPVATASPTTSGPAPRAPSSLATLVGAWRSTSNRDYLAVASDPDTVEFRIQQASQHPRQGYETGEVRFELKTIPGKRDEFGVEDHIRPTPPDGFDYDPRTSRDSCVGTWTNLKGKKLLANLDAKGNLVVDLVQIRTGLNKFKTDGDRVVACNDLTTAPAEPIESRLQRVH